MTKHLNTRMNQRGITKDMIALACDFGELCRDKYILNRDSLDKLLAELSALSAVAKKARDKGGIVVVEKDGVQLTAYNHNNAGNSRG